MKKILLVFGTRPEAIKLCPLILELRLRPREFTVVVCVTAQHRQMLDQVLNVFGVVPEYDLNVMKANQSLFDITTTCLSALGSVIRNEKPDIVVLQGDTTTTFVGALASYYEKVKVAHVEAGLRTYDKYSPFPEEINRRLTSSIADYHFSPTQVTKSNLLKEGVSENSIYVVGNTVIDALLMVRAKIYNENKFMPELQGVNFSKRIILVTGHRRENFGEGFKNVCIALKEVALANQDVELVFPVHLNPNVRKPVNELLTGIDNVLLIEPLDYEPFIYLMDKAYLIVTDSGGIQEEAPSLGKPVIVTRDNTERPEAVTIGAAKLVGTNTETIVREVNRLLSDLRYYESMSHKKNPYGDGDASKKICEVLNRD